MKLYRFHASSMQKAIFTVTETLGPNALVYSTRKLGNGIEVIAGLPHGADAIIDQSELEKYKGMKEEDNYDEVNIKEAIEDNQILETLNMQVKAMNENIQTLTTMMEVMQKKFIESNLLMRILQFHDWEKLFPNVLSFFKLIGTLTQRRKLKINQLR